MSDTRRKPEAAPGTEGRCGTRGTLPIREGVPVGASTTPAPSATVGASGCHRVPLGTTFLKDRES